MKDEGGQFILHPSSFILLVDAPPPPQLQGFNSSQAERNNRWSVSLR
jgi:hypothetical protein